MTKCGHWGFMVPVPNAASKAMTRTLSISVPIQICRFSHYHHSSDQKKSVHPEPETVTVCSVELGKEDGNIPVGWTFKLYHILLFGVKILRASPLFLPSTSPSGPQFLLRGTEDSGGRVTFHLFIVFPGCAGGGSPLTLP